jgi:antitoxin component of MazEF toxin-antitoxin module
MEAIKTRVKKWGNSFGIVLPIEIVHQEKIKEGSEISISIEPSDRTHVRDLMLLSKKLGLKKVNIRQSLDEIDREFED